jgi:hypothetical protein
VSNGVRLEKLTGYIRDWADALASRVLDIVEAFL